MRGAVRVAGLRRGRAAGEVRARLQDPRHLRGHAADPAADHCATGAGEEFGGTEIREKIFISESSLGLGYNYQQPKVIFFFTLY